MKFRTGIGYDVHKLVPRRRLVIGGETIPHHLGSLAHSDGDVLIHAVCDALLGAAALGDIGHHFPDTSGEYKNIDSMLLLEKVGELLHRKNFTISNIDSVICLQKPRLQSFIPSMVKNIAKVLKIDPEDVSVKATTSENLGFTGREEGVSAQASALIYKI